MGVKNPIEIVTLDSSSPNKKRDWIEDIINNGFTDITFIDDIEENVYEVSMLKNKYCNINLQCKYFQI